MAQVISDQNHTLPNSVMLTRPNLRTFFQPDTNAGSTDITQFKEMLSHRQLHLPMSTGAPDYKVICCDANNVVNRGQLAITSQKRKEYKLLDPLNGFISCAGEVLLNTGSYGTVPSFSNSKIEPHTTVPQNVHSIRTHNEAIDELKRKREEASTPELKWNSNKVSDITLRSRLGGWTSDMDVRQDEKLKSSILIKKLNDYYPNLQVSYTSEEERDKLANRYRYTTSTQAMYGQVNWDSKLPQKLHAPVSTYEAGTPDPLRNKKEGDARPQIWQTKIGAEWDRAQMRSTNFHRQKVSFTAPTRRGNQLPGYGGQICGKNGEYKDDVFEKFEPYATVRTTQPKEPASNFKPNIPGYTGHIHHFKTNSVSHYDENGSPITTYSAYHRLMPDIIEISPSINRANCELATIQTKVPPANPYNQLKNDTNVEINHSMDNVSHPIVINSKTNDQSYLIKNREKELRSILKKRLSTTLY